MSSNENTFPAHNTDRFDAAAAGVADKVRAGGKAVAREAEDLGNAVKRRADDAADRVITAADSVADAVEDGAEGAANRLSRVASQAQDMALGAKDAVVSGAASTLATVRDVAIERADAARETLSDVGDRLAATLQRASGDADSDAVGAKVMSTVADGLTRASTALRERSVADLTSDVRELARRHPGAFMAAAAVVGFAAARFIRSSAQRRVAQDIMDEARRHRS